MAKVNIPCLVAKRNKAGITSWYWQPSKTLAAAGWKAMPLGKNEGAAIAAARVRNQEVERWKAGGADVPQVKRRQQSGTFGALVDRYRKEHVNGRKPDGRPLLKPKTREVYETGLKRLEHWAGKHPVAYITPARVRALRDANAKPIEEGGLGHAATFNLLRLLRQVFAFAESVDVIPKGSNPATDFGLGKPPRRKQLWTPEDDSAFDTAARDLGLPSMALARELALYSAQRESDLIRFTEGQLVELEILEPVLRDRLQDQDRKVFGWSLTQGKTSTDYADVRLEIPLEPSILEKVRQQLRHNRARDRAADPPRLLSHVLVDDRTGLPWKQRAFIEAWRTILDHAAEKTGRENMRDLVWHDLRRTRVVRLRRIGMAKEMIAALTGHSLRSIEEMLAVYGPVDPTITANAIVASLAPLPAKEAEAEKEKPGRC